MDSLIYIAMSGAKQTTLAQSIHANNLANAKTTGFKADLEYFESVSAGGSFDSRVFPVSGKASTDFSGGSIMTTGRELDVAVDGDGWIAVQDNNGKEAYTRAGNLRLTETGQLITGSGQPVLGNGGPIVIPPAEKIEIGIDGTINIRGVGQAATTLATVDRIKLVRPDHADLQKGEDGLIHHKDPDTDLVPDASVHLVSGALESSNVNPVNELTSILSLARQFEMQVKMMKSAEDNDAQAAQIMQLVV